VPQTDAGRTGETDEGEVREGDIELVDRVGNQGEGER
jgi:hypothetical protein